MLRISSNDCIGTSDEAPHQTVSPVEHNDTGPCKWSHDEAKDSPRTHHIPSAAVTVGDPIDAGGRKYVCRGTYNGDDVALAQHRGPPYTARQTTLRVSHTLSLLPPSRYLTRLIGVCVYDTDRCFLVSDLAPYGSLRDVLLGVGVGYPVTHVTLTDRCIILRDILQAMEVLAHNHWIHRDLCARNILVFEWFPILVKIADMDGAILTHDAPYDPHDATASMDTYPAPEVIESQTYSEQSDVWSFGCVCYELFTLSPTCPVTDIHHVMQRDVVPDMCPTQCPDALWNILVTCFRHDPNDRPTFRMLRDGVEAYMAGTKP